LEEDKMRKGRSKVSNILKKNKILKKLEKRFAAAAEKPLLQQRIIRQAKKFWNE
jgi:hypothetical protein